MRSRIRGGDAARAAVATTEHLPVTLQATDLVGPFQPVPEVTLGKSPTRARKTFGTFSEEFADTMMGKMISGLRPNAHDILGEATLNAALATVASLRPGSEIEALISVQIVIAGFSALR